MRRSLTLLFIFAVTADAQPPKRYDLSTPSKIAAALDEVAHLQPSHCSDWLPGFPDVFLVGSFANDYGCTPSGYFADGYYVADRKDSAAALRAGGWTNRAKRPALALAWASAALIGAAVRLDENLAPPIPDFAKPSALAQPDGSVVVTMWVEQPVGMKQTRRCSRVEVTFSSAGQATLKYLGQFSTPL